MASAVFHVVRIHQHGIAQFTSGAGEAAKDQTPLFVMPRGDKLLGDQVHPVVQGGHETEICRLVVALDLLVVVMPLQENNWLPPARLEAPVNSFGLGFHVSQQVVITLDVACGWCSGNCEQ